ncbi:MAG: hypothetical protein M1840_008312 [Geoglossum simile]|nr:MAG: hypothetical protein M1840_008312 [Geoglossum simile]
MAFRLVANPAIQARPFPSPRHLPRLQLCLSSRPYSELKYDEVWKNEIQKNWKSWTRAAAAGGLTDTENIRGIRTSLIVIPQSMRSVRELRRSQQWDVAGLKKPKDVVYVMIPNTDTVETNLSIVINAVIDALAWNLNPVLDSGNTATSIFEVFRVFSRVALRYQNAYQVIPVLDFAKETSDSGIATIIFVSSEGRILCHMRERSAWSRVQRVFKIGDVSRDEALQYLRLQCIDNKMAAQIYELVGMCMILLKSMARNIQKRVRIDDLHCALLNEAKGQLKAAKMLPRGEFYKQEKAIISKLLKENAISNDTYWAIARDKIEEKMLQGNVFSHHFDADNITFQSTLMKRYCELHSTLWEG